MSPSVSRLLQCAPLAAALCASVAVADLAESFRSPPGEARLWVYWTCQDGHYSIDGTTADLEAMKAAGVGGVLRMDCSVGGIPFGGTPYLSEDWRRQFVHAVHECERLGLEFTTITGPGWTGTGGPWIKAEQSMQHLVPASVTTRGPATFEQVLPLPQPRISRYHRAQTPHMRKAISDFYRDVAVFAFPTRQPLIGDIQEKALFIRNPYTSMRGVRPHLPSPASYPAATAAQVIDPTAIVDLTDQLQADGRLTWDVPQGEWTIVRLGVRSTGANTRPAPAAGLGLESDKFSKEALATHFEAYFDPLLKAIGPRPVDREVGFVSLDADSWEMSSQNWTPSFRNEFKKRRGYDPWRYFVTYTGCVVGSREQTERFLWDVRAVCQELLLENHAAELSKHCHQRGFRLMIEPYDMNPAGDLDLGSYADYPAGEFWSDGFLSGWSCIAAASIAHTMGKPIVLAEGFTSGRGNWARTPWTLKNQTDWAFAVGINKFAIHGFAHQSDETAPGMTFGPYGVFWNRKLTFWPLVGGYHEYLARCSHLLQQGVTVSDILYLTPEGAPQVFLPPPTALNAAGSRLPDKKGYSFDGCSPRILMNRAEVRDGRIAFPGGTSYRLLVLPRFETMTPELLEKIIELVEAGAVVYGAPPLASPSLSGYPACDERVKALARKLWGSSPVAARDLGLGRVILDRAGQDKDTDKPLLPGTGKWIWLNEGSPAHDAAAGDVHFRHTLDIPDITLLKAASIEATADNSFMLEVNGERVLSGDNWQRIERAKLLPVLRNGTNTIHVVANNAASDTRNPAGFLVAIRLAFADGTSREIGSDRTWSARRNGADWSAAKELGPGTMPPWSLSPPSASAAPTGLYPEYADTATLLSGMGVPEDFKSDGPIRYAHRRTANEDIYFVANTTGNKVDSTCEFRITRGSPQMWDPVTATIGALPQFERREKTTSVPMTFEPFQSFFVVFPRDEQPTGTPVVQGVNFPATTAVTTLDGPWEVSFDPEWGGPEQVTFNTLQDWTAREEEGIKYYSGIATYRKVISLPRRGGAKAGIQSSAISGRGNTDHRSLVTGHSPLYLDLGTVHDLARVTLNGKDLGVVWCAPWRIEITDAVTPGENQLEVQVANRWPNRMIGDAGKPAAERLTSSLIRHPYNSKSRLLPSGLLGPVRIMQDIAGD